MAERNGWWKSITTRKKKESVVQHEGGPEPPLDKSPAALISDSQENQPPNQRTEPDFDEQKLDPALNDKTFRRNLKISRSGRFKEKRKVRATLPENNNFYEGSSPGVTEDLH
ncbi:proline-rich protein 15 [Amia ocellicauda]|uniref:proline-rich protein 15 n=1 Tax=Amia ocellicauda TaxID=2972642 RepID=UPI003464849C